MIELEAEPGGSANGIVKLYNESSDNLFLDLELEAFTSGNESGQPVYLPPESKFDYLDWFTVGQDSILLTPQQIALVPFSVDVPTDAVPGGYYAVIFWKNSGATAPKTAPIVVSSRVGTLVFLKVKGDIKESGELVEFGTGNGQSVFYELPVNFVVRFANTGNIHLRPRGSIELKNIFGDTKILAVNSDQRNILPNSTRLFATTWGYGAVGSNMIQQFWNELKQEFNNGSFGRYTATLNLTYGDSEQSLVSPPVSFWVVPWRLLVVTLAGLAVVVFLFRLNRKINRFKKQLAQKGNNG